ncbi:MAG TPA: hypothetical protein VJ306_13475 [Pyrinomonadaceae bacterium]|jgi:hypothetical protein|nr:hypothetical protein [Pyrinomonadaceae bacterium]
MKRFLFSRSLLLILCLLVFCSLAWGQPRSNPAPLTNASIVKLVKAGFKEKSIITIIASRPVSFDLSTDRIIELKRTGVSEKVILAMMARQEGSEFSDEMLSDDEFFKQSTSVAKDPGQTSDPGNGTSTNIFGSSGGSQGSVKTRGGSGSSSGDTITTGSATVRILRPPTEGGGEPTKLEKTKSLTNDSICELVEAGFSEGTIIRRIEQSPVEFDLSAAKVEELRKRRVSEKILAAMKAAMGDESSK